MTRLSCHCFRFNGVRLALSLLAYNLGNFVAAAVLAQANRDLVADRLAAAIGENCGRLVKRARYCWLLLVGSHLTRRLFAGMVRRIVALPLPAGWGPRGKQIGRNQGEGTDV
jgi:hypothetical protein